MTTATSVQTPPVITKPALAFAGTGWIGLNRMKSLLNEKICRPLSIYDPVKENALRAREAAEDAIISSSFEELLSLEPDGIVLATPSALHTEQAIAALKAGIAVFCQKPLARNSYEVLQVIKTAKKADKLLGLDLSYRFTDGMQKIHKMAVAGELGDIYAIDLIFHNAYGPDKQWFYNPQLSGGGCLIDLGIHLVDLAMWILGFPSVENVASSMFAKGKKLEGCFPQVAEDYVSAQFETEKGTLVRLTCSWNLPAGQDADIQASFYGTKASALFYNVNGSFYDFGTNLCHGTSRRVISSHPEDWGGRALINWTRQLQEDDSFSDDAMEFYYTADVIDKIYRKKI